MNKKSDNAVMKDYLADLDKLQNWRERAEQTRGGTLLQTVFLGDDGRNKGLPQALLQTLIDESQYLGIGLIYFNRDGVVTTPP